ncbi:MAG: flagellar biosynthetic protein FliR [Nitrospirae bacterium]|nr:flagellar biosynthetic protein FliR [Candidatus Manganitrophaceae bacterium]
MNIPLVEGILENQMVFLFILFRVAAFLAATPLMGGSGVPVMVKMMLVLSMSFVLFQTLSLEPPGELNLVSLTIALLGEVLIGLIIGMAANLLFSAIEMGSEIVGIQMGLGSANLFDPISNKQASLIARLQGLVAMLIFLVLNGHFIVLESMVKSFELIPFAGFYPSGPLIEYLMKLAGQMFLLGLKVAIPIIVALLMANVTIGIFSRVIPQLNVLLFSFPVTITLGLVMLGFSLPILTGILTQEVSGLRTVFNQLLVGMSP